MFASLGLNRYHQSNPAPLPQDTRFSGRALAYRGKELVASLFDLSVVSLSSIARAREPAITSVASPRKIIWIRPEDIVFKIVGDHELKASEVLPGEWDLKRNLVADTKKYRSISQHFLEDVPWQDTVLFEMYARRLGSGELVRGVDSLAKLARVYETKVDALYRDLSANGFRIARDLLGQPTNVPHVHIGRGGEILYGTKGNHRLAMAKLLSIRLIPCHVRARHADWQKIRDAILSDVALTEGGREPSNLYREFRGHPDLADLFYPNQ